MHAVLLATLVSTVSSWQGPLGMSSMGDALAQACCQELDMFLKAFPEINSVCLVEDCTQWLRNRRASCPFNNTSCPVTENVLCEKLPSFGRFNGTKTLQNGDRSAHGYITVRNVLRVVDTQTWRSCAIAYDAKAWPAVDTLSGFLSDRRIHFVLYDLTIFSSDTSAWTDMLQQIFTQLRITNLIVLSSFAAIDTLFREAERYDRQLGRTSGLRMFTQWIVATSSGLEEQVTRTAGYFDNVVVIFEEPHIIISDAAGLNHNKLECVTTDISTLMYVNSKKKNGYKRELQSVTAAVPDAGQLVVHDAFPNTHHGFNQRTLIVGTKEKPDCFGRSIYSGICIDLLQELAHFLNFTPVLKVPPSQKGWGSQNETDHWEGLVGLLYRQEVDVALSALHLSEEHGLALESAGPFLTTNVAGVFKKPDPTLMKWKTYLGLFQEEVLLGLGITLVVVTCMVHVMAWLDPTRDDEENEEDPEDKEKNKKEKEAKKKGDKEAQFPGPSPDDGFWYLFGGMVSQGGMYLPESSSSRMLVSAWWLFCIVIAATYNGNLFAFLTVNVENKPFQTLVELLHQDAYRWGVVNRSSEHSTLLYSKDPALRELGLKLQEHAAEDPDVLSMDPDVQKAKVVSGGYVFITDSLTTEAWIRENCNLDQVVCRDSASPALALYLPRSSNYTHLFSEYVMRMVEAGLVIKAERDWFADSLRCTRSMVTESPKTSLIDVLSLLYLGLAGFGLALLSLACEFLCHRYPKLRFWTSLVEGAGVNGYEEETEKHEKNDTGQDSRIPQNIRNPRNDREAGKDGDPYGPMELAVIFDGNGQENKSFLEIFDPNSAGCLKGVLEYPTEDFGRETDGLVLQPFYMTLRRDSHTPEIPDDARVTT